MNAIKHLGLPPEKCAMVAAHMHDHHAAAPLGMKTVYIRREGEDEGIRAQVKSKVEGGEVDVVVDSIGEILSFQ